jgi:hypothetical protein
LIVRQREFDQRRFILHAKVLLEILEQVAHEKAGSMQFYLEPGLSIKV